MWWEARGLSPTPAQHYQHDSHDQQAHTITNTSLANDQILIIFPKVLHCSYLRFLFPSTFVDGLLAGQPFNQLCVIQVPIGLVLQPLTFFAFSLQDLKYTHAHTHTHTHAHTHTHTHKHTRTYTHTCTHTKRRRRYPLKP